MKNPDDYVSPKVWTRRENNGGAFTISNRPIAGAAHEKELPVDRQPRELRRLLSTLPLQIHFAPFDSDERLDMRQKDYRRLCESVLSGDAQAAQQEARRHVKHVRKFMEKLPATPERH